MGVDESELGRGHAQLDALLGDAQVAGEGQLQAAPDRVPGEHREGGIGEGFKCVDGFCERVGDELLRSLFELLRGNLPDVIAG